MEIIQIPLWSDNYGYLVCAGKRCAIVDPTEAGPVARAIEREGLEPVAIWNTHHHPDHVGGNRELIERFGIEEVVGSKPDEKRVPGLTAALEDGASFSVDGVSVATFFTPGHTVGAIAYYIASANAVFSGDTLFTAGCGRLFEGSPAQMVESMTKYRNLPEETRVYCGHEYTLKNLEFALTVEPGNQVLRERHARVKAARARGESTVPATIAEEQETNPFLRWDSPEIIESARKRGGATGDDPVSVFAAIRKLKDQF